MSNNNESELRWMGGVIRRWWWLIVACMLLGGIVALAITAWLPPTYRATATLLVEPGQDTQRSDYSSLMAGERLALTYGQMLEGRPVLDAVISRLGLELTPEELSKKIVAEPIASTQLIRLTVSDSSPEQAAQLANTIAEIFTANVQDLQTERYAGLLQNVQNQMDAALAKMTETQASIDKLSTIKIESEAQLGRAERLLADLRSDYRNLQQDYEELQLAQVQAAHNVRIVEAAQVPAQSVKYPYVATATLLIDQVPEAGGDDYGAILASERLAQTYTEILAGRQVLEAALAQMESAESPEALARKVQVEPVKGTQLIRLSVEDADAAQAKLYADAIAAAFINQINNLLAEPNAARLATLQTQIDDLLAEIEDTQSEVETLSTQKIQADTQLARLEGQLAEDRSDYRALKQDYEQLQLAANDASQAVSIVEAAQLPESPDQSRVLYIGLAVLTCAVAAIGIVFLWEYLDDTIRTPEDVSRIPGGTMLATIGRLPPGENELVVISQPRSPMAESFRILATNIRFCSPDRPLRTLLVTSPSSEEGKSIVLANLAAAMAGSGQRIVVVDADLRVPRLHKVFQLTDEKGLTDSLMDSSVDGSLQSTKLDGLKVITSGKLPPNPVEIVASARLRRFLTEIEELADLVIIDSPPLLPVADAAILTSLVDGVILVFRAGQTRYRAAQQAVSSLRQAGAQLIGIVLNAVPSSGDGYSSYYRYEQEDKTRSSSTLRESPDGETKTGSPVLSRMKTSLATVRKMFDKQKEA